MFEIVIRNDSSLLRPARKGVFVADRQETVDAIDVAQSGNNPWQRPHDLAPAARVGDALTICNPLLDITGTPSNASGAQAQWRGKGSQASITVDRTCGSLDHGTHIFKFEYRVNRVHKFVLEVVVLRDSS